MNGSTGDITPYRSQHWRSGDPTAHHLDQRNTYISADNKRVSRVEAIVVIECWSTVLVWAASPSPIVRQ